MSGRKHFVAVIASILTLAPIRLAVMRLMLRRERAEVKRLAAAERAIAMAAGDYRRAERLAHIIQELEAAE